MKHHETTRSQVLRHRLVQGIREKGITDEGVLKALATVPRHLFMGKGQQAQAYIDKAYPIGEGQTISQPYTVAYQSQLLQVQPQDKILEIGTGSGYQAAILAEMEAIVYSIERIEALYRRNQSFDYLSKQRRIHLYHGDGYEGLPAQAPFDKILITAAAPEVPEKLLMQLKIGGHLVLPVGAQGSLQRMIRITKKADNSFEEEAFDLFSFVPMLKGKS